jgi:hypothetical protein
LLQRYELYFIFPNNSLKIALSALRLSKYAIFVSKLAKNVFFAGFAIGKSKIIVTFAAVV